jgi:alkanesulfonate monooxygenase
MRGMMRLAAYFNPTGHHVASWRHPRAQVNAHINIRHDIEIAQTAERAKIDMIFLADGVATREAHMDALSRSVQFVAHLEPLTSPSALASVTDRIGLVATAAESGSSAPSWSRSRTVTTSASA